MSELRLGPPGADKIAIVGSAPTSVQLAPYRQNDWTIWGVSPGAYGLAERKDVWFELHRWEPQVPGYPSDPHAKPWFSPEYVRFLEEFPGPVMMLEAVPSVKNCVLYPFQRMLERFGPYHFQSTMSWMLAYAIEQRPKAIGIWGVDCAATEEWAEQRPGVQHFLGIAAELGIELVIPLESDLLQPTTMYGIMETNPRHAKLNARRQELTNRLNHAINQKNHFTTEEIFLKGALDDLGYVMKQWTMDINPKIQLAVSRSSRLAMIPDPLTMMRDSGWPDEAAPAHAEQVTIVPIMPQAFAVPAEVTPTQADVKTVALVHNVPGDITWPGNGAHPPQKMRTRRKRDASGRLHAANGRFASRA